MVFRIWGIFLKLRPKTCVQLYSSSFIAKSTMLVKKSIIRFSKIKIVAWERLTLSLFLSAANVALNLLYKSTLNSTVSTQFLHCLSWLSGLKPMAELLQLYNISGDLAKGLQHKVCSHDIRVNISGHQEQVMTPCQGCGLFQAPTVP